MRAGRQGSLRDAVAPLLVDTARRTGMATQAKHLGRPDAADRLTDLLLNAPARQ